ncbi:hypothetical protein B0F90DRAFT_50917 [Multifurca ochricompacta]|uniref:Uncharacterized protein n=1 Tax=Multifurca ochricompacta TaxID=376703 RepID=A0AAD4MDP0_9AGAM|nr:hypothetical protein B0F90DRAFT_50917 [Multifurca ochricompacta]
MPRAATNLKHAEHFVNVGNGKWLCNICKADAMTVKQAIIHETSAQHSSKAEVCNIQTSSVRQNPTSDISLSLRIAEQERSHWRDWSPSLVCFWRRGLEAAERGEEAEPMHEFLDRLEEELAEKGIQDRWGTSPVDGWGWGTPAEDWTPAPDVWASSWNKPIAKVPSSVKHVRRRREDSSITSVHREGNAFDRNDAHQDDNGGNDAAFVEDFLQCHAVDARRGERMRMFYDMPTDQKIRKIQEIIRDLREG